MGIRKEPQMREYLPLLGLLMFCGPMAALGLLAVRAKRIREAEEDRAFLESLPPKK
jgi:hypothetical protein